MGFKAPMYDGPNVWSDAVFGDWSSGDRDIGWVILVIHMTVESCSTKIAILGISFINAHF